MTRVLACLVLMGLVGCSSGDMCVAYSSTTLLPPHAALHVQWTFVADGGGLGGYEETNDLSDAGLSIGGFESCAGGSGDGAIHAVAWIDPGASQDGDGGCGGDDFSLCVPQPGDLTATADFTLNAGDHLTVPLVFR